MEDRHTVARVRIRDSPDDNVCAVFDGHSGKELSEFSSANLLQQVSACLQQFPLDPGRALVEALDNLDTMARQSMPECTAGTTACVVYVTPTSLVTSNVGDSRAILLRSGAQTLDLSRDHKPSDKSEEDRILRSGGFVTRPEQGDGVHRVMGRLSLSRALGDWDMRPWVSSMPDITIHNRSPQDEYIVLATDGVWDVLSSGEVDQMLKGTLRQGHRPQKALERVLNECRKRGSGDNITIVLADLRAQPPSVPATQRQVVGRRNR
jgi:serine/threonine protein phosphatase PrpC